MGEGRRIHFGVRGVSHGHGKIGNSDEKAQSGVIEMLRTHQKTAAKTDVTIN